MSKRILNNSISKLASICILTLLIAVSSPLQLQGQKEKDSPELDDILPSEDNQFERLSVLIALLNETEKYGESRFTADIHSKIGRIYENNGLYEQALFHFSQAYTIYTKLSSNDGSSKEGAMWTLYDIGNIFYRMEQFNFAKTVYLKSTARFAKENDFYAIASCFSNIGLCYNQSQVFDSAHHYFYKALEIRQRLDDESLIAHSYSQLGSLYMNAGNNDRALNYFLKSSEIHSALDNHYNLVFSYILLSRCFVQTMELDSAEKYLLTSLNIATSNKNNELLVYVYHELSGIYLKQGKFNKAKETNTLSIELAEELNKIPLLSLVYFSMYEICQASGDYKCALHHYLLHNEQESLMKNKNTEEKLKQMEFKIMSENIRMQLTTIEKENRIHQIQNKNKSNVLYYFVVSSIVLLLFALGNIRKFNYRFKLLSDFMSGYSTIQLFIFSLLVCFYFSAFFFTFTPFGIETSPIQPGWKSYIMSGMIFTINLFFWTYVFAVLEKKIRNTVFLKHRYLIMSIAIDLATAFSMHTFLVYYIKVEVEGYLFFSLMMFTFIAYILPLYIILIVIEKYLLKKHALEAKKLNQHFKTIHDEKKEVKEVQKTITLKSNLTKEELETEVDKMLYIEAQGNYCRIVCIDENNNVVLHMIRMTMLLAEEQCNSYNNLVRCHKSFIVNTNHIQRVSGNSRGYLVGLNYTDEKIPISKKYYSEKINLSKT
jgi:tetratricopeptide (TPR) repeat protein